MFAHISAIHTPRGVTFKLLCLQYFDKSSNSVSFVVRTITIIPPDALWLKVSKKRKQLIAAQMLTKSIFEITLMGLRNPFLMKYKPACIVFIMQHSCAGCIACCMHLHGNLLFCHKPILLKFKFFIKFLHNNFFLHLKFSHQFAKVITYLISKLINI